MTDTTTVASPARPTGNRAAALFPRSRRCSPCSAAGIAGSTAWFAIERDAGLASGRQNAGIVVFAASRLRTLPPEEAISVSSVVDAAAAERIDKAG